MATPGSSVIVGIFKDRDAVAATIDELVKMGIRQEQIGFAARHEGARAVHEHLRQGEREQAGSGSIMRGIVGGIMGAVDMLLMPATGPADASAILATTLPATESMIDRWSARHRPREAKPQTSNERVEAELEERVTVSQPDQEREQHERTSAITGSVVGGVVGTSIAVLLVPGVGPILAGGLLAAAFGGAALGGVAGNFLGTFVDLGIPHHRASHYEREIKAGRTILTIQTDLRQREIMDVLSRHGAYDVEAH